MLVDKNKVIYPELSYKINKVLFSTKKRLGQYKNEKQYCDDIEEGFKQEQILYEREKVLPASFLGEIKGRNKVDFWVDNKVVLEVKAKQFVTKEDYYQTRRYLDALNAKLGILVNMRSYYVNPKRILNSKAEVKDFA